MISTLSPADKLTSLNAKLAAKVCRYSARDLLAENRGAVMAMTHCNECGHEISTTARSCPKCGAVVPRPSKWPLIVMWVVFTPLALLGAMLLIGSLTPDYWIEAHDKRDACKAIYATQRAHYSADVANSECQKIYDETIAAGKASNAK